MAQKRRNQPKRPTVPRLMCKAETKTVVRSVALTVAAAIGRELNQDELVDALIRVGAAHLDEVAGLLREADEAQAPADEDIQNGESQ